MSVDLYSQQIVQALEEKKKIFLAFFKMSECVCLNTFCRSRKKPATSYKHWATFAPAEVSLMSKEKESFRPTLYILK